MVSCCGIGLTAVPLRHPHEAEHTCRTDVKKHRDRKRLPEVATEGVVEVRGGGGSRWVVLT